MIRRLHLLGLKVELVQMVPMGIKGCMVLEQTQYLSLWIALQSQRVNEGT